jgi:hypothetical protein
MVNVMTEYVMSSQLSDRATLSNLRRNMSTFLQSSVWISLPKVERIFNVQILLRQVHRLFQSEFSRQYDLVFRVSNSSIFP